MRRYVVVTPCSASSSAIATRRLQRQVDVVAEEEVARLRALAEAREAVAAGLRRLEELAVVVEVEGARHAATSTSSRAAAASARRSASSGVVCDRDDVAAAVAVAAYGADRLADLEVRLRLDDASRCEDGVEVADADTRPVGSGPGDGGEEADRERLGEAGQRELVGDVLAERLANRDLDEVDADGVAHEVRHLAACDARRDLDHGDAAVRARR